MTEIELLNERMVKMAANAVEQLDSVCENYGDATKRIWTITKEPHNTLTNCYWFLIQNKRTGKSYRHYAQEFCRGQIHFDHATDKFPNYIHEKMWRLIG